MEVLNTILTYIDLGTNIVKCHFELLLIQTPQHLQGVVARQNTSWTQLKTGLTGKRWWMNVRSGNQNEYVGQGIDDDDDY